MYRYMYIYIYIYTHIVIYCFDQPQKILRGQVTLPMKQGCRGHPTPEQKVAIRNLLIRVGCTLLDLSFLIHMVYVLYVCVVYLLYRWFSCCVCLFCTLLDLCTSSLHLVGKGVSD